MSRYAKSSGPQADSPRRAWPESAAASAVPHAAAALARAGFADATLVLRWAEIAGPEVARLAAPVKLAGGAGGATLTLRCESGAAVFLQHQTRQIMARLNAYLGAGAIARIVLVPGRLARESEPPAHPAANRAIPQSDGTDEATLAGALERFGRIRAGGKARISRSTD
jgi:hypothetical protein